MRGARGLHHRGGDRGRRGDHARGRSRHICAAGARRPEPHHRDGAVAVARARGRRSARLRCRSAAQPRQERDRRVAAIRPQPDAGINPTPASTRCPHRPDAAHLRIEALHQGPPCVAEGAITRRILASPLPDETEVMLDRKIVGRDVREFPPSELLLHGDSI